ncbi:AAA family ATPase [Buchananella hordeovulneris]|uniref:AAA family ATPase n=1 Tax=Buchananella hordeovulneris TaxID=52770 RepID=A0A1Q5PTN5_9ACTO|nr:AAA family ATPase [Buchananella hordeovulneris]OKL50750.1 hypothetical protein BSZ40_10990 [Buchananella hordeovulneris]
MSTLIVVSGLPGTGKTTLATALAAHLKAAYLRVDVVETPLVKAGIDVGPLGYEIVRQLAAANLAIGTTAVVDLVNPLPVTRQMWPALAAGTNAALVVFECVLPDADEHRRRVESRVPDLPGQVVPTWQEVVSREYIPWDEQRDGTRHVLDTSDLATAFTLALALCQPRVSGSGQGALPWT